MMVWSQSMMLVESQPSTMTPDDIVLEHDKANMTLDDSQAKLEMGQSQVVVEDGTTYSW